MVIATESVNVLYLTLSIYRQWSAGHLLHHQYPTLWCALQLRSWNRGSYLSVFWPVWLWWMAFIALQGSILIAPLGKTIERLELLPHHFAGLLLFLGESLLNVCVRARVRMSSTRTCGVINSLMLHLDSLAAQRRKVSAVHCPSVDICLVCFSLIKAKRKRSCLRWCQQMKRTREHTGKFPVFV